MPPTKTQNWQVVQQGATPIIGMPARTDNETLIAAIEKHLNAPFRLFASATPDALLHIGASIAVMGDGAGRVITAVDGTTPVTSEITINHQTGAVVGGTVKVGGAAFAFPSITVGNYIRASYAVDGQSVINVRFSPEAASKAALEDQGVSEAALDGLGTLIGHVVLKAVTTNTYKTADSVTNVIENSVGGVPQIFRFGSGSGGGSGTGDTTYIEQALEGAGQDLPYELLTLVDFKKHKALRTDVSSTGAYEPASKSFKLTTTGQTFVSYNLLDDSFIADGLQVTQIDFIVIWKPGSIDSAATYWASRNGGTNYEQITMTRIGSTTDTFHGRLIFDSAVADTSDLRVKVVSGTDNVKIDGLGVYYQNVDAGMMIFGRNNSEMQVFDGKTEKLSPCSFTLTRFIPDPDFIIAICDGGVYHSGDFTIDGSKITFPDNFFETPETKTMKIKFMHVGAGSFDASDRNANLLAAAHIASADPNFDRSVAGRGVPVRRPDGTIREIGVDDNDIVVVLDT